MSASRFRGEPLPFRDARTFPRRCHFPRRCPTGQPASVIEQSIFLLDNEPNYWSGTHRDVHPPEGHVQPLAAARGRVAVAARLHPQPEAQLEVARRRVALGPRKHEGARLAVAAGRQQQRAVDDGRGAVERALVRRRAEVVVEPLRLAAR